jgi:peptide-methionine (R)-S-oxide reductase
MSTHHKHWKTMALAVALAMAGPLLVVLLAAAGRDPGPAASAGERSGSGEEARKVSDEIEIYSVEKGEMVRVERVDLSDEAWKERLGPDQYRILRKKGTERAFTGTYWSTKEEGVYRCAACGSDLFLSDTKYDSGSGWPSFWQPVSEANVRTEADRSLFMKRTEVLCARCGGHLGHVFDDGPQPTGRRWCINSASIRLEGRDGEDGAPNQD